MLIRAQEQQILEDIASGVALPVVLTSIAGLLEARIPGSLCAIHLLDPVRQVLTHPLCPSLPPDFGESTEGLAIGPKVGSCGTAAYRGEPVLVADIDTDPLWDDYRQYTRPYGLRACWSYPLLTPTVEPGLKRAVLGTLAIYRRECGLPDEDIAPVLEGAIRLASVALEHSRTVAALQESEARYRMIVDNSGDAMFVHDSSGIIVDANRSALDTLGLTRAELVGSQPFLYDHDLTPEQKLRINERLHNDEDVAFETRHRRRDGTLFPVEVRVSPFKVGHEQYGIAIARDISERRKVEASLGRVAHMLRRAQSIAQMAAWTYDVDSDAFRGTGELAERLGCSNDQPVSARTLNNVLHPDDAGRVRSAWKTALAGAPYDVEYRVVLGDEVRWLHATAHADEIVDGRVTRITGVTQDVTARRRLEEQVQQSQKMEAVGLLAGGIAHDFNNLLTVITGHTELLLAKMPADNPARQDLVAVRDAGRRAARLTSQLLAFSRKALVEPRVLNVNTVVASMGDMLDRLLGETVRLSVYLEPKLHAVNADAGQIEQLLMNLAVNARDAMPDGGTLSIRTTNWRVTAGSQADGDCHPGDYVCISVADTGCGMTDAVKAHIFEPFFTTKERGKGTGLGLSTVFGIVQQAGGDISLSTAVNAGTEFRILLPALTRSSMPASEPVDEALPARGRETVLVAEDEEGVRRVVRTVLQAQGYTVIEARNGAEALAAAEAHPDAIDLLLTDVVMPDLGGRALADRVKAVRPGIYVLYMSGYADDALTRRGVSEDGDPFLQKPFTPQALTRKVRSVLGA